MINQFIIYVFAGAVAVLPITAVAQPWQVVPQYDAGEQVPLAQSSDYREVSLSQVTPLTLSGNWIGATDQPYMAKMNWQERDRLSRLSQERLNTRLSGTAWQSTILASEFRWLPPEKGKGLVSPFIIGGMSLTNIEAPTVAAAKQPDDTLARGWRYGGGFAYSWSTELDIKLGYQASAIPALSETKVAAAGEEEQWRTQIVDVSIAYRF